ncbi:Protein of unknown function [Singulisphaera sp. GP187]|uniref:DUF1264 domain-containing protein n=1 Tax=Singulisphaera sp. GP187 TaxID=1882752 RepID=UPI000928F56E|nr:DUF1264 domain-containing protein [Singulisphaera sp. GP187]SIO41838.1 Protein of unknown function [Singulisphaera sp. GP187]
MREHLWSQSKSRPSLAVLFACLFGMAAGAFLTNLSRPSRARADDGKAAHAPPPLPSVKAPIQEVLHCPLAFAGVHLMKDLPEHAQVAYHYCKPVNDDLSQCILYDGTGPDAHLIGIEYLVSDAFYQKMPPEEKLYWHNHKYEIDSGLLKSLTQVGAEAKQTLAAVRPLWGKVFHTWASGKSYPTGPPRLFWSVTGEDPFVLSPHAKLPVELEASQADRPEKPAGR